jgi:hypothetical protein
MFLDKVKPWNTRVQYRNVREMEQGHIDPEKRISIVHHDEVAGDTPVKVTEETEKKDAGATSVV